MRSLKEELAEELQRSRTNNFGKENYDEYRFGQWNPSESLLKFVKRIAKQISGYDKVSFSKLFHAAFAKLRPYEDGLERIYKNLNAESKSLFVKLLAYRILGYKKVKLPTNTPEYQQALIKVKSLKNSSDTYDPHFKHFTLEKFNLTSIGYDIHLYFADIGIVVDFINEQYAYKNNGNVLVGAEQGDVVLDVGGCWGDTALYFASKIGDTGKVYSFEFIPDNIKLFKINTSLNPELDKRIELVNHPASDRSGIPIYFQDNGPASKMQLDPFEDQTGSTYTISIDDFVIKNNITKVDFIKMDIEGAEPIALLGAVNTIKRFRPKLAIATYHSMNDFVGIPNWILDLNLDYEIFIGHYTIHAEETVCFAKPRAV